jgi:sucrose-6-phosphate hydrolase SacC (GH32 family)
MLNARLFHSVILSLTLFLVFASSARSQENLLIADFEQPDYGSWKTTGEAFGSGPAHDALPGQMPMSGFLGKGFVSSYHKGDASTGTLTSQPFSIERPYLRFLIGGGQYPGETCVNLLIDNKGVRTATGPNAQPGGNERLDWNTWDVTEFKGKTAQIQIVDKKQGGWGHVNVDQIEQSNTPQGILITEQEIKITHPFFSVNVPAQNADQTEIALTTKDQTLLSFKGKPSSLPGWISWDVASMKGQQGKLRLQKKVGSDGEKNLKDGIAQQDSPKGFLVGSTRPYGETYRPQFHFTARKNWLNDPNGLVFYKGQYHLFFQHNPQGNEWGNMTWGHAVSPDLLHWKQLENALTPDALGTIYSGSAVVDWKNTSGFKTGSEDPLVCFYTSAGKPFTQSLAYSNDRGQTWTKYEKNPVLGHIKGENRDPKVIWHEPTQKWVMALYLDGNDYALYGSKNLKQWDLLCNIQLPGVTECPDFFEIAIDGDPARKTWLFWGATGDYLLGSFDGKTFKPENGPYRSNWGGNFYAAQTWSDIPEKDGRRLQIAWMNNSQYPGMPFNQQMSFPCEMTVRTTPEGPRLFLNPACEIEKLHKKANKWENLSLKPGENPLSGLTGDLFDIRLTLEPAQATSIHLALRGEEIRYNPTKGEISCLGKTAPLKLQNGRVQLQILLDRTSLELFGNNGQISMTSWCLPDLTHHLLELQAEGGDARIVSLEVFELDSTWEDSSR